MNIERIAAFSIDGAGGNPAGIALCAALPEPGEMARIAAEVGFSETAFAAPGAAAAVLSGWLRDSGRLTGEITIRQGEDMGAPSRLHAVSAAGEGAPVRVAGATRRLD